VPSTKPKPCVAAGRCVNLTDRFPGFRHSRERFSASRHPYGRFLVSRHSRESGNDGPPLFPTLDARGWEMSAAWPRVRLGEVLRHRKEFITIDDLETYQRPRVQLHVQGIVLRNEVPGALIKTNKAAGSGWITSLSGYATLTRPTVSPGFRPIGLHPGYKSFRTVSDTDSSASADMSARRLRHRRSSLV
jgi:hypothetical protein